ncbi:hypothetical protein E2C01_087450 [Portunus trituberculatus]|uniref:Uncharacterized protein n=1 Tax=Portunus trituberculatus TaxID=210409 RepID=A0A5B7JJ97_PORTR|nr:hypothetical protein [Portunus trituberculatus]
MSDPQPRTSAATSIPRSCQAACIHTTTHTHTSAPHSTPTHTHTRPPSLLRTRLRRPSELTLQTLFALTISTKPIKTKRSSSPSDLPLTLIGRRSPVNPFIKPGL